MKRFNLKPEFSLSFIDKKRLWFGVAIFLLFSFTFYLFGLYLKDGFRIFSESWHDESWYIKPNQYYLLNFLLAFVSIVFGSLIMFEFWFITPKSLFKINLRTSSIFNEARLFIWVVIFITFALLFYSWVFFSGHSMQICFDFLPELIFIFILLVAVLYLSLWNGFIRKFKSAWKFQSLHLMVSIMLSALFALYVPERIKSASEMGRSNQIKNMYSFNIPYIRHYHPNKLARKFLTFPVYILNENKEIGECTYIIDKTKYDFDKLEKAFLRRVSMYDEADNKFLTIQLFADIDVPMEKVIQVREIIQDARIRNIFYVIKTTPDNCNQPSLGTYGIKRRYFPWANLFMLNEKGDNSSLPPLPENYFYKLQSYLLSDSTLLLNIDMEGQFLLFSDVSDLRNLPVVLEKYWYPKSRFNLVYEPEVRYEDYVRTMAYLNSFILRKRNLYAQHYYGCNYSQMREIEGYRKIQKIVPPFLEYDALEMKRILEQQP